MVAGPSDQQLRCRTDESIDGEGPTTGVAHRQALQQRSDIDRRSGGCDEIARQHHLVELARRRSGATASATAASIVRRADVTIAVSHLSGIDHWGRRWRPRFDVPNRRDPGRTVAASHHHLGHDDH